MKSTNINPLKESEERLQLVFDNMYETIVVAQDEKVKYCNSQILELSGYSIAEIQSMNFSDLIHPDDKEKVMLEYQARLSGELPKNRYAIRISMKNGLEKFVHVSSSLINWDGSPATLAMITDITKIKKAELDLKRSEERFRQLMEQSPLAMEILSPAGKINLVNPAWRKMWQVTEEEAALTIEKYNMLTDPQLVKLGIMDQVQEAFKGKHIILPPIQYDTSETIDDFDLDILQELRSPWIQCHLNSVKDAEGNILYIVNTYLDITDITNAWKNVEKSEYRFQQIIEFTPLATSIWRPDGKNIQVNDAWKKLWGLSEEETAQVLEKYNFLTDEEVKRNGYAPLIERAFRGEQITVPPMEYIGNRTLDELELKDMEGSTRWIQTHLSSVKNDNGEIEYVVAINTDLTDLKQAEQDAHAHRDILARMDRATNLGQLTGSIAHELNQPLTGILGNAQAVEMMLRNKSSNSAEILEIIGDIVADTKRAGNVIRNLRELYREQKSEIEAIDINFIVDETLLLLHSEFVKYDVKVKKIPATNVPEINGNKVQVQQVLVNLLMNAIEAMNAIEVENNSITITTASNKKEVKVEVDDEGPGITEDKLDLIFQPLATWKSGGTGMGLAISNSIIESHGGTMYAKNLPDGGARIGFKLPIIDEN